MPTFPASQDTSRWFRLIRRFASFALLGSHTLFAHEDPGYSHEQILPVFKLDWMNGLDPATRLSELSLPGTHDTMALYWGDIGQTQSMKLIAQLSAGIRVLDIRCVVRSDTSFAIYHGISDQYSTLDEVLLTCGLFLQVHPRETIFMMIGKEHSSDDAPRFNRVFDHYYNHPLLGSYIWKPQAPGSEMPTLGQVRGKTVILQSFPQDPAHPERWYGLNYGGYYNTQNDYELADNWELYDKWTKVKNQLAAANTGPTDTIYFNWLSGSTGALPYFVASGHSSPGTGAPRLITGKLASSGLYPDFPREGDTILFEGTNVLTYHWLQSNFRNRVGIVMADFPGPGLIERIIERNRSHYSFADVNGDGKAELVVQNSHRTYVGQIGAKISLVDWSAEPFYGSQGTFFTDVTGEGPADAIVVNDDVIKVRQSLREGKFHLWEEKQRYRHNWTKEPFHGALGTYFSNVTSDRQADAIAVNAGGITVRRSRYTEFSASETWTAEPFFGPLGTFFADVDGDGMADAIAVDFAGIQVRRSDGKQFLPAERWTANPYFGSHGTFFADVTGDKRADAIVVNAGSITVRRAENGKFSDKYEDWSLQDFHSGYATAFADVDGDGKADALAVKPDPFGDRVQMVTVGYSDGNAFPTGLLRNYRFRFEGN